jgi:hypothetical protein
LAGDGGGMNKAIDLLTRVQDLNNANLIEVCQDSYLPKMLNINKD